jgi:hypothetical protein
MKKLFDYKINFIKTNPMLSVGISFFKGVIITLLILLPYLSFSQTSDKWVQTPQPIIDAMTTRQLTQTDIQRNANLIIFMVTENQIRNFNRWRIWHKLKERKRNRIVRRWQKRHERNNIKPEFLRRGHR